MALIGKVVGGCARGLLGRAGGAGVANPGRDRGLESLEARVLLATPTFTFTSYYAEGFSSTTINEFVPITNPNAFPVTVELSARYEFGARDQVIGTQVIPAQTRFGFVVSDSQNGGGQGTRNNVPYALIVRATDVVAANFSHYDFGTAIGEGFTTTTDRNWSFAEGSRDSTKVAQEDFILVYNPNGAAANLVLTIFQGTAAPKTFNLSLGAERRGGWSINDLTGLTNGSYGATITSDVPIVAVQSRYKPNQGRGYGALGTPGGGNTVGVINAGFFGDDFYDLNGDDGKLPRFAADTVISILNANTSAANVVLVFKTNGPGGTVRARQTIALNANSQTSLSLRDLGVDQDLEFGIAYSSDRVVTVAGTTYQGMDATGSSSASIAATVWDFGEGYMSRSRGGSGVLEDLYFFNPTGGRANITISVFLNDGVSPPLIIPAETFSLEFSNTKLHGDLPLRFGAAERFYGLRVTSDVPIAAYFQHWDSGNGGGFGTFGLASGTIQSIGGLLPPSFFFGGIVG
jgi:hypothetical protein